MTPARKLAVLEPVRQAQAPVNSWCGHMPASVATLIRETALKYIVTPKMILGPSRERQVVAARTEICRKLREKNVSVSRIGYWLHIHHSTVTHAVYKKKPTWRRERPLKDTFIDGQGIDWSGEWAI